MALNSPDQYRVLKGTFASDRETHGNNGFFEIPVLVNGRKITLRALCGDGEGWEHVSVSMADRLPSWEMMCKVKELFWGPEDCVVQFHPPRSDYVNLHPHCLHLWRPIGQEMPRPPTWMVGPVTG